jgi:hypothetical protein
VSDNVYVLARLQLSNLINDPVKSIFLANLDERVVLTGHPALVDRLDDLALENFSFACH